VDRIRRVAGLPRKVEKAYGLKPEQEGKLRAISRNFDEDSTMSSPSGQAHERKMKQGHLGATIFSRGEAIAIFRASKISGRNEVRALGEWRLDHRGHARPGWRKILQTLA